MLRYLTRILEFFNYKLLNSSFTIHTIWKILEILHFSLAVYLFYAKECVYNISKTFLGLTVKVFNLHVGDCIVYSLNSLYYLWFYTWFLDKLQQGFLNKRELQLNPCNIISIFIISELYLFAKWLLIP